MLVRPLLVRPLLLGHRGGRGNRFAPENTLAAFDLALEQGCDGFEFDVRLSGDGQAVVCHDAKFGGRDIAQTSARESRLPLLREVLQRYRGKAFLDIELKVAGLEAATLNLLQAYPPARGCVISSFLPEVLVELHRKNSTVPLGLICETRPEFDLWRSLPVQYVIPHYKLLERSQLAVLKRKERRVIVWTVNSTAAMKKFAGWGVHGIIADDPGVLAHSLDREKDA
jgi:glycerophosphoryl diester phosphodiesterase